jgi:hypothetical protein
MMNVTLSEAHLEYITKFVAMREKSPKMARFWLQAASRSLLPDGRIHVCYRHRLPMRETVDLKHSPSKQNAFYCGLMKCGLAWVCPLCAVRLSEQRREMLTIALDNARSIFLPVMVTYTVRHNASQRLADLLGGMLAAYRRMRQSRAWRTLKDEFMVEGEIRTVEITYGDDGWHPHFHVVLFMTIDILHFARQTRQNAQGEAIGVDYDLNHIRTALEGHIVPMWLDALRFYGLDALAERALRVTSDYDELSGYVTKFGSELPESDRKWTLAEEATKGSSKKARSDNNLGVWEILLYAGIGVKRFEALFLEYASATQGKSGLQWTPGLRERLGVEDTEGKILHDESEPDEVLLAQFDYQQWQLILRHNAAGRILDIAATGDDERVYKFLDGLTESERGASVPYPSPMTY